MSIIFAFKFQSDSLYNTANVLLCKFHANNFNKFRLSTVQYLFFENFLHFGLFFALVMFVGTFCVISTKTHLLYGKLFSNAFDSKYQLMKSIREVVVLLLISWSVNWLVVYIKDSLVKVFSCVLIQALTKSLTVLICLFQTPPMWLQVSGLLIQAIQSALYICEYLFILLWVMSWKNFRNSLNVPTVTFVVRPHLSNVASTIYKLSHW